MTDLREDIERAGTLLVPFDGASDLTDWLVETIDRMGPYWRPDPGLGPPPPPVTVYIPYLLRAARLIEAEYDGRIGGRATDRLRWRDLRVQLVRPSEHKPLAIIRGPDDLHDWVGDFRVLDTDTAESGDSSRRYARGLIEDARIAHAFCKAAGVGAVLGHSRGAILAAIVGWSLGVPTFAFGCPRYLAAERTNGAPFPLALTLDDIKIAFVNRPEDLVVDLPPRASGLCRCGVEFTLPALPHLKEGHRIRHYIEALEHVQEVRTAHKYLRGVLKLS